MQAWAVIRRLNYNVLRLPSNLRHTSHANVDTGTFICWPPRCVNTVALSAVCLVTSLRWQRGDRRERPRRGRLHRAERLRGDQRQSDGASHHDQRLQDRLGLPCDRRHPVFPVRSAGQEGQGGGERYLSNYFCHPAWWGKPRRRPCPSATTCQRIFMHSFYFSLVSFHMLCWVSFALFIFTCFRSNVLHSK